MKVIEDVRSGKDKGTTYATFEDFKKDTEIRIISLYRTGTHSDIFGKGKKR